MSEDSRFLLISLEKVDEHGWPVLMMHEVNIFPKPSSDNA